MRACSAASRAAASSSARSLRLLARRRPRPLELLAELGLALRGGGARRGEIRRMLCLAALRGGARPGLRRRALGPALRGNGPRVGELRGQLLGAPLGGRARGVRLFERTLDFRKACAAAREQLLRLAQVGDRGLQGILGAHGCRAGFDRETIVTRGLVGLQVGDRELVGAIEVDSRRARIHLYIIPCIVMGKF